jgi:hypothetical protein
MEVTRSGKGTDGNWSTVRDTNGWMKAVVGVKGMSLFQEITYASQKCKSLQNLNSNQIPTPGKA